MHSENNNANTGNLDSAQLDKLGDPEDDMVSIPISRVEIKAIVEYWLREYARIEALWVYHRCTGGAEMRAQAHAMGRIREMINSGLISESVVREMAAVIVPNDEHGAEYRAHDPENRSSDMASTAHTEDAAQTQAQSSTPTKNEAGGNEFVWS